MAFIVKIEGQTIELPENIAQDDQKIRESLAPFYPEIGQNSLITRAEKDGNIEITISKRAGTKGGASQPPSNTAIVEQLRTTLEELPEGGNSAVEMYRQLKKIRQGSPGSYPDRTGRTQRKNRRGNFNGT